jgi:hypothetical protein
MACQVLIPSKQSQMDIEGPLLLELKSHDNIISVKNITVRGVRSHVPRCRTIIRVNSMKASF